MYRDLFSRNSGKARVVMKYGDDTSVWMPIESRAGSQPLTDS